MKYLIAIIAAAFTLGACATQTSHTCPAGSTSCPHGKGDSCCAEKAPAKKK
jgi:hypothetical protein